MSAGKYFYIVLELFIVSFPSEFHSQITEQGIEHLVLNCPSIEVIDLTECQNITDNAIDLITLYSKRLKTLKVIGCTQLTNRSLDSIQQNCKYIKVIK